MTELTDDRWSKLTGGYHTQYDARPLLVKFEESGPTHENWDEVWNELYHQGDIGTSSFAVLPHLVSACQGQSDIHLFSFAATVIARAGRGKNPKIPDWLKADVEKANKTLFDRAIANLKKDVRAADLRYVLAFIAAFKGAPELASALMDMDVCPECEDFIERYGEAGD